MGGNEVRKGLFLFVVFLWAGKYWRIGILREIIQHKAEIDNVYIGKDLLGQWVWVGCIDKLRKVSALNRIMKY